ncbi:hypothetical protein [Yokenella regensburgei]|uniref:hypothetical protein n=1 Tax=Yokenella regensburgei TaxID=158877 RepID=UPI00289812F2|nr:hypothetical protein [Yokenella regensburgei]
MDVPTFHAGSDLVCWRMMLAVLILSQISALHAAPTMPVALLMENSVETCSRVAAKTQQFDLFEVDPAEESEAFLTPQSEHQRCMDKSPDTLAFVAADGSAFDEVASSPPIPYRRDNVSKSENQQMRQTYQTIGMCRTSRQPRKPSSLLHPRCSLLRARPNRPLSEGQLILYFAGVLAVVLLLRAVILSGK